MEAVSKQLEQLRSEYDSLCKRRLDEFMEGFGEITIKLKVTESISSSANVVGNVSYDYFWWRRRA